MTNLIAKRADNGVHKVNAHFSRLQTFADSFDRQFRELLLLQYDVLKMLHDTVKRIDKSNK